MFSQKHLRLSVRKLIRMSFTAEMFSQNVHQEVFSRQSLFLEITMILQKLPVIKTNKEKSIKQGQNIITQFLVSLKNKKDQLQK